MKEWVRSRKPTDCLDGIVLTVFPFSSLTTRSRWRGHSSRTRSFVRSHRRVGGRSFSFPFFEVHLASTPLVNSCPPFRRVRFSSRARRGRLLHPVSLSPPPPPRS